MLEYNIILCTFRTTIYVEQSTSWYDYKTHKEIINIKLFSKISAAISPAGLIGLDRLFAFMIVSLFQKFLGRSPKTDYLIKKKQLIYFFVKGNLQKGVLKDNSWLEMLTTMHTELQTNEIVVNPSKFYQNFNNRCVKVWPQILDWTLRIGHLQLLRKHVAYELNKSCKFNCKNLESSLRTLNE